MPDVTNHYNLQKAGSGTVQSKWSLYDGNADSVERGRTIKALAGEALTAYDLVFLKAADQKFWKATNGDRPLAGLMIAAAGVGVAGYALEEGVITNTGWAWTAGGLIYASTTAGGLTQTEPTENPIPVALALTATQIWLFRSGLHARGLALPRDFYRQVGTTPLERWYVAGQNAAGALGTVAPATGTLFAYPFLVPKRSTLDRLALNVTVAGAAGARARLGIYRPTSLTNLYPAGLVLDGGEIVTDAAGVQALTISQVLNPGLFWLVALFGTASPTVRAVLVAEAWPIFGIDSGLGTTPGVGLSVAQAYGVLPGTFPAAGTVITTDLVAVACRLA